ncbi:MAG: DnaJ domain-containing protein [Candidatus Helarchaeota archaeon]
MKRNLDFYNILGVKRDARPEEIRRKYRELAKKYHPDLNPSKDAEEKIKLINIAYNVLSDADKKRKYDFMLRYGMRSPEQNVNYVYVDLEEFLREIQNMTSEELNEFIKAQMDVLYNQIITNLRNLRGRIETTIKDTVNFGRERARKFAKSFFPRLSRMLFKDENESK